MTAQWPLMPIRRLGRIINGGTPGGAGENWSGDVPFVTPPDMRPVHGHQIVDTSRTISKAAALTGSSIAPPGSVVVSIRAPIGYVVTLTKESAFNQGCRAISPFESVCARYLSYALQSAASEFAALGRGTTFMEVSASQFGAFELPLPPRIAQVVIADYLDRETAQIDALIQKQVQLIEVLRERQESYIALVVTRGVDSPADPVGGGNPSFGDVSFGRAVKPLRRIASFTTGTTPTGEYDELFSETGDLGWATPEDLRSNTIARRRLTHTGAVQVRPVPKGSSLVCCIGATLAKVGYSAEVIASNQQITALSPYSMNGRYLYYSLQCAKAGYDLVISREYATDPKQRETQGTLNTCSPSSRAARDCQRP